jgi:hypothetical protein
MSSGTNITIQASIDNNQPHKYLGVEDDANWSSAAAFRGGCESAPICVNNAFFEASEAPRTAPTVKVLKGSALSGLKVEIWERQSSSVRRRTAFDGHSPVKCKKVFWGTVHD